MKDRSGRFQFSVGKPRAGWALSPASRRLLRFESLESRIVLDSTAVFNEVMYNPPGASESGEWIEIHNQLALDIDLSGWTIEGGIDYAFPDDTVLPADGYLVIAADPAGLAAQGVSGSIGPYSGSLSNGGEEIRLVNNSGRRMDRLDYDDGGLWNEGGAWPVGPDGVGASLAKINENRTSELASNWQTSAEAGGSPGMPNGSRNSLPALKLNEIDAAGSSTFFIEMRNRDVAPLNAAQFVLRIEGVVDAAYPLPTQVIGVGGYLIVGATDLGFTPADGDRIFLIEGATGAVVDAQRVTDRVHGVAEESQDRWLYPSIATAGQPNVFSLNEDLVVNEIFYHAPPQYAAAPHDAVETLVAANQLWRYNESGSDLGTAWARTVHPVDQVDWFAGPGLLAYETAPLPEPIGTTLTNPQTNNPAVVTYYFETEFQFSGDLSDPELQLLLRHYVDDGAIFFLNGNEVARFNMPGGSVTANTRAASAVGNASASALTPIPRSSLAVGTNRLSVEVHQASTNSSDVVFGVELLARQSVAQTAYAERNEEWIELYHRGEAPLDLTGWRIEGGVDFAFPDGYTLAPGEYVVLTADSTSFLQKYAAANVLGGLTRRLSNNDDVIRLVDASGNPADEVHYFEGGRWPELADGQGASLELRDPWADNSRGEAWAASVIGDAAWQTISYRGLAGEPPGTNNPSVWEEFIFGLLDSGSLLVDDVSVIEDPDGAAIERLQDGSFDHGSEAWRLVGTHGQHGLSGVIADPDDPANQVLHIVSTGATEHMSNHVETTFAGGAAIQPGVEYEISLRARWLSGSPQLYTRLYFNQLARVTILEIAEQYGTPGAENSRRETNVGPTYDQLKHTPIVPTAGEAVEVSVIADDRDQVASIVLRYAVDGGAEVSVSTTRGSDGRYRGVIPGQAAGSSVQFYVEGVDGLGAVSHFPAEGPDSRAMYQVEDATPGGPHHTFRIVLTEDDYDAMVEPINRMSNNRLRGTVIFDDAEAYYDVGIRLKGSGFSRGGAGTGFNLRFGADDLLFGVHDVVAIDRTGGPWGLGASHRELTLKHIANRAGNIPMMMDDAIYFVGPDSNLNGTAQLLAARYDDEFLESQYENGGDGARFKFDLIYYSTRTQSGDPEDFKLPPGFAVPGVFPVLGIDIKDLGDEPNAYRSNFLIRNQRGRDDYSQIIAMGKAFSLHGSTVGGTLDTTSQAVIDVDQWMRVFAMHSLVGSHDTYNQGLPHNLQFYVRPMDNRVLALPWDLDFAFWKPTTDSIYGSGSNLSKIIQIPSNRRLFQGHLHDMISTAYNRNYLQPWIAHLATRSVEDNSSALLSYVTERRGYVLGQLMPEVSFEITTAGGADFAVSTDDVSLAGDGWINVREIRLAGASDPLPVRWTDDDSWEIDLPLTPGVNPIVLEAYDFQGELVGADAITVTTTGGDLVAASLKLTEIHYHPPSPSPAELLAIPGLDDNDFEFLEFVNAGALPIDLEGVQLVDGVEFVFPAQTLLPGAAVVVAKDLAAFELRYGDAVNVAGVFSAGALSNGGERIAVQSASGFTLADVTYDDAAPWPASADGSGDALHHLSNEPYGLATSWTAAPPSPGLASANPATGDFDDDADVDGRDFLAWQRGHGLSGAATLADGDGDRNGVVNGFDRQWWERQFGGSGIGVAARLSSDVAEAESRAYARMRYAPAVRTMSFNTSVAAELETRQISEVLLLEEAFASFRPASTAAVEEGSLAETAAEEKVRGERGQHARRASARDKVFEGLAGEVW